MRPRRTWPRHGTASAPARSSPGYLCGESFVQTAPLALVRRSRQTNSRMGSTCDHFMERSRQVQISPLHRRAASLSRTRTRIGKNARRNLGRPATMITKSCPGATLTAAGASFGTAPILRSCASGVDSRISQPAKFDSTHPARFT